jgi:hypothetical protein
VAAPALSVLQVGTLALIGSSAGDLIHIGNTLDDVDKIVRVPTGSGEFRELPPGFEQPYTAKGYENAQGGFGAIYYESHLAQATSHEDNLTLPQVDSTVKAYEKLMGVPRTEIPGNLVKYWFWEDLAQGQRLMLCAVQNRKDVRRFDLTCALGDSKVMDQLRMSPAAAREDRLALETPNSPVEHPG